MFTEIENLITFYAQNAEDKTIASSEIVVCNIN